MLYRNLNECHNLYYNSSSYVVRCFFFSHFHISIQILRHLFASLVNYHHHPLKYDASHEAEAWYLTMKLPPGGTCFRGVTSDGNYLLYHHQLSQRTEWHIDHSFAAVEEERGTNSINFQNFHSNNFHSLNAFYTICLFACFLFVWLLSVSRILTLF